MRVLGIRLFAFLVISVWLAGHSTAFAQMPLAGEPIDSTLKGGISNAPITLTPGAKSIGPLTLQDAVNTALKNYPAIRESEARIESAKANVSLSKTSYLPSVSFFEQTDRATDNKVNGQFLPELGLASISGPEHTYQTFNSAWYTAFGTYISWQPFDFGLRKANVTVARSGVTQAGTALTLTRFDVASRAATSYLNLLAALKFVLTAETNIHRLQVVETYVHDLVRVGLRPGADESRVQAQLAAATVALTQAEAQAEENRAVLAQNMGLAGQTVIINGGDMVQVPLETIIPTLPLANHPLLINQQTTIHTIQLREVALKRTVFPVFSLVAGLNDRGSGLDENANFTGGVRGLYPTRPNGIVGLLINYTPTDRIANRDQQKIELGNEHAERARYDEMAEEIVGRRAQASVELTSAMRVARETPVELAAARTAELQIRSRYKAGFGTIVDIADVERVLAEAEINDSLARLKVWSALLDESISQGSLTPFMTLLSSQTPMKGTP